MYFKFEPRMQMNCIAIDYANVLSLSFPQHRNALCMTATVKQLTYMPRFVLFPFFFPLSISIVGRDASIQIDEIRVHKLQLFYQTAGWLFGCKWLVGCFVVNDLLVVFLLLLLALLVLPFCEAALFNSFVLICARFVN